MIFSIQDLYVLPKHKSAPGDLSGYLVNAYGENLEQLLGNAEVTVLDKEGEEAMKGWISDAPAEDRPAIEGSIEIEFERIWREHDQAGMDWRINQQIDENKVSAR